MNVSLYQAASAMSATAQWQDTIAANMANSAQAGFKRNDVSFESIQAGLMNQQSDGANKINNRFVLTGLEGSTDFTNGEMRYTGHPTDVAIEGSGFFEVQMPDGSFAYTRDGQFRLNSQGVLTTTSGNVVSSNNGNIQVDLSNPAPINISKDGEVSQGNTPLGKIRVMDTANPALLTRTGSSYFMATDPNVNMLESANPAMRQHFVEASNTNATEEMANLMSAMRLFEANQKTVQIHDDRMGKAINALGNVS